MANPLTSISNYLADTFGPRSKTPATRTAGVSGIQSAGGYVQSNERDPRLVGEQKWISYTDILNNTAIVAASVRYFLNLVAKAEWKADPVDDTPAAVEAAEFVDEVLDRMDTSWHRIVRRAALYRFYGFSIQEWTASKWEDGRIGLKDIELRPQRTIRRWDMDASGTVQGVAQLSPQIGQELYMARSKILYLVDDALTDSPEGVGLMRHLWEPAERARRYKELEGWGFETDLRGIPVAKAPLSLLQKQLSDKIITQAQYDQAIAQMKDFVKDHIKSASTGLLVNSEPYRNFDPAQNPTSIPMWGFELLTGGATGFAELGNALDRLNHEMAWILGTEQFLLGSDSGSFALSKSKSNSLYLVVDSVLKEIAQGAERDVVDSLWALNGFDDDLKPKLQTESAQFKDVEQITAALRDMATAGAPLAPDDEAINSVRALLNLPDASMTDPMAGIDAALMGFGVKPEDLGLPPKVEKPEDEEDVEIPERKPAAKTFVAFNSPVARKRRALAKRIRGKK